MNRDPEKDAEKDEALFALLAASDDPRAAFEASPLAGDEYCRARFAEVFGFAAELDALGVEERASLLRSLECEVESGPAESVLREAIGAPRGHLRGWHFLAFAAALLAVFALPFLIGNGDGGDGGIDPHIVMGGAVELSPSGTLDTVELFDWSETQRRDGHARVFVYDKETGAEILSSPVLRETEWRPTPAELATLTEVPRPRSYTWKISFYDDSGAEPFSDWGEFELR